jgi:hypothetical protein
MFYFIFIIFIGLGIGLYSIIDWDKLDDKIEWFEQFKKK